MNRGAEHGDGGASWSWAFGAERWAAFAAFMAVGLAAYALVVWRVRAGATRAPRHPAPSPK
jgi:hypothetical protein